MSKIKLGELPSSKEHRDAMHMAVAPVIAAKILVPGQHVSINKKGQATTSNAPIGIVDPFLLKPVKKGERFWLVLYPNSIGEVRHTWEHPSFTNEDVQESKATETTGLSENDVWLANFAAELNMSVSELTEAVRKNVHDGEGVELNMSYINDIKEKYEKLMAIMKIKYGWGFSVDYCCPTAPPSLFEFEDGETYPYGEW